jgi:hypothetical protein
MLPGDGSLPDVKRLLSTATVLNVTPFRTAAKGQEESLPALKAEWPRRVDIRPSQELPRTAG